MSYRIIRGADGVKRVVNEATGTPVGVLTDPTPGVPVFIADETPEPVGFATVCVNALCLAMPYVVAAYIGAAVALYGAGVLPIR